MSEIKVDTLTGKTTANDITVTVGATATAKLEQGLAKCWFNYDQDAPAVDDSFNITSITDVGTGQFDPQWNNNFSNVNYACTGMGPETLYVTQDDGHGETVLTTTADCGMRMIQYTGSYVDAEQTMVVAHGDLA